MNFFNSFEKTNKRPLRVLHIGNIANNAYVNAKIMEDITLMQMLCVQMLILFIVVQSGKIWT